MLVQWGKLNYVESGLSRLCGGPDTGNSHMRFYDVTSWSYVNLDDPPELEATESWAGPGNEASDTALFDFKTV